MGLLDSSENREQEYEYKVVDAGNKGGSLVSIGSGTSEKTINKWAKKGWRLVETVESAKGTSQLIFEREVDE